MTPTLIAMIGPAGAGKTTWRTRHAPPGAEVVSLDGIRAALSPCGCSADQAVNDAAFDAGIATTHWVLAAGGTVLWDATSYLPQFRTELLDLAQEYRAHTVGLVILPPLLTVLARNGSRDATPCPDCGYARRVADHVVWRMHHDIATAVPHLHREGWHELRFLALPPYLHTRQHRPEES
ncbi:AAA family ATPase [Amycolatopsis sp. NPDC102389]|uniref:AAA family ATPase n=1 Tax=Amycolatopsis sp. NPDC102389 TaxID=3363941 RepID=UPI0037F6FF42